MNKLGLCLIVKGTKDEAAHLDQCLASIAPFVQGIFIDFNAPKGKKVAKECIKVAEKYKANYVETVWTGHFVKARNDNFARVTKDYEWILWLDADDTMENPHKIAEVLAIMPSDYSGLYINYNYEFDKYGNVLVNHWVARIVRNNDTYHWKSSFADGEATVHETLVEKRGVGNLKNDEFSVKHNSNGERMDESLIRNIGILEQMYEKSKEEPDPRILFYLAAHYMDARIWNKAKPLFERYLTMSGWAAERSQAYVHLGDIYKAMGQPDAARGCYMRAVGEDPGDPSPYVELGELELANQMWEKSIEWLLMATDKKERSTTIVQRPLEATYRAYKLLSEAYANLDAKGLKDALKWLKKAIKLRPYEPELLQAKKTLEELERVKKLNQAGLRLVNELRETKELDKIIPLVDNFPKDMQDSPLALNIRNYYDEPKIWAKKTIAIMCGPSALGEWGPWSLEEGIGGSEEAVVHLSNQLTKLGWHVTVYATPGNRAGEYDGVGWVNYWTFNARDTFDVLIGWRSPSMFDKAFKARKRYLWLHDVIDAPELTPERLDNLEKVIFVSQYHRDLFKKEVPDNKAFASGNGIAPEDFEKWDGKIERNPKKVVYMSAHERGQDLLQSVWKDVVKVVPDAQLHCYYGWKGYDHINRNNPERMQWKEKLIDSGKHLKGFIDHDKVGHEEIVKEIFSAGVWAYPTGFPEVYCITGAKAMAGGAWPVTSNHAALKEIVPYGDKVEIPENEYNIGLWDEEKTEQFTNKLINALQNPVNDGQRKEMMDFARAERSWSATAQKWDEEFGDGEN